MTVLTKNREDICNIQGEVFVLATRKGYKCSDFVRKFMKSLVCEYIDELNENPRTYSHEEQEAPDQPLEMTAVDLLEKLEKEEKMVKASAPGESYSEEVMMWMGWLYRYWHYYDNCRPSNKVWRKANAQTMKAHYEELKEADPIDAITKILKDSAEDLWKTKR